ncbi:ASPARTYL PROTEASE-RELATED [Salix purpurea]|uniref:ASPARTYL PROTEASE-RELATED n=1 Tax=Salix purpurea TaxID=77065 RepID=A0A9Q0QE43_SALPP|nr:ASPARTYL PROTEASE-RELATED [Salix purpurea]
MIPGKIIDWNKKLQKRLIMDNFQLRSLQSRMKKITLSRNIDVSVDTQIPLTSGVRLQTLNYMVTVELGGQKMTVIVDTGSDLELVRSYSSTRRSLQFATGNSGSVCGSNPPTCNYAVNYCDGSYTSGEKLRLQVHWSWVEIPRFTENTTPISYTRMIKNSLLPFYFLNLTGITALKAEFMKLFSGYPSAPSLMILDSCFNLSGYQEVEIPDIKMYFEGSAELNVDVTGVFYFIKTDASQCAWLFQVSQMKMKMTLA